MPDAHITDPQASEITRRLRSRNRVVMALLGGLIVLFYAITIVQFGLR